MDLADPALWVAVVVGILGFMVYMKVRVREPPPPQCRDCDTPMDLEEEIVDPDNPEQRYIPGERRGWFRCPQCRRRARMRY